MSEDAKENTGASKLDEGATKLDEGATKLHEGATVLHEIAATMSNGDGPRAGATSAPETRARLAQLRVQLADSGARALDLVKRHPVATVAAVGVAAAFIEVDLAVGMLAGVVAAALLVEQAGPEVRQRLVTRGRHTLDRARSAWVSRTGGSAPATVGAEAAVS